MLGDSWQTGRASVGSWGIRRKKKKEMREKKTKEPVWQTMSGGAAAGVRLG
jgi:hypothetical protein